MGWQGLWRTVSSQTHAIHIVISCSGVSGCCKVKEMRRYVPCHPIYNDLSSRERTWPSRVLG
eukprot:2964542-Pyramimonas_sp.AAC.1